MKLDQFDSMQCQCIVSIALDTGVAPDRIAGAAMRPGDVWEVRAFLLHYPDGTPEAARLIERLRQGDEAPESIHDIINFAAPSYVSIAEQTDAELDRLLNSVG